MKPMSILGTPAPPKPAASPEPEPASGWVWLLIGAGLACLALVSWWYVRPTMDDPVQVSHFLGSFLGSLFWPLLAGYLAGGRKHNRNPARFATWFFMLALVVSLSVFGQGLRQREKVHWTLRDLNLQTRKAQADMKNEFLADPKCDVEPPMYSDASLTGRRAVRESVIRYQECFAWIREADQRQRKLAADAKKRIQDADLPASMKSVLLDNAREIIRLANAERDSLIALLIQWEDATLALYAFAERNTGRIRIGPDGVLNVDAAVNDRFHELRSAAINASDEYLAAEARVEQAIGAHAERIASKHK